MPSAVSSARHSSRGVEARRASGPLLTRRGVETLATALRVVEAGVEDVVDDNARAMDDTCHLGVVHTMDGGVRPRSLVAAHTTHPSAFVGRDVDDRGADAKATAVGCSVDAGGDVARAGRRQVSSARLFVLLRAALASFRRYVRPSSTSIVRRSRPKPEFAVLAHRRRGAPKEKGAVGVYFEGRMWVRGHGRGLDVVGRHRGESGDIVVCPRVSTDTSLRISVSWRFAAGRPSWHVARGELRREHCWRWRSA